MKKGIFSWSLPVLFLLACVLLLSFWDLRKSYAGASENPMIDNFYMPEQSESLPNHLDFNLPKEFDVTYQGQYNLSVQSGESARFINTGLKSVLEYKNCSAQTELLLNEKIQEISNSNFQLDVLVNELKFDCKLDMDSTGLLLTLGKMKNGAKENTDDKEVTGVMGFRLTLQPKRIPIIQNWLKKHNLKITKIDVTRYNHDSDERFEIKDLSHPDMTSVAIYLSRSHDLHTFFIYKRPDNGTTHARGLTAGLVKLFDAPMSPQFFMLAHNSRSDFVDLDVLIASLTVELRSDVWFTVTVAEVKENLYKEQERELILSVKKRLYKKGPKIMDVLLGLTFTQDNEGEIDRDFKFQLKGQY